MCQLLTPARPLPRESWVQELGVWVQTCLLHFSCRGAQKVRCTRGNGWTKCTGMKRNSSELQSFFKTLPHPVWLWWTCVVPCLSHPPAVQGHRRAAPAPSAAVSPIPSCKEVIDSPPEPPLTAHFKE